MNEKTFRRTRIDPWLREKKNIAVVKPIGGMYCMPGVADYLLCVSGEFVALEAKASDGRQTELQKKFQLEVENAGGIYLLASPDNWDAVLEELRKIYGNQR